MLEKSCSLLVLLTFFFTSAFAEPDTIELGDPPALIEMKNAWKENLKKKSIPAYDSYMADLAKVRTALERNGKPVDAQALLEEIQNASRMAMQYGVLPIWNQNLAKFPDVKAARNRCHRNLGQIAKKTNLRYLSGLKKLKNRMSRAGQRDAAQVVAEEIALVQKAGGDLKKIAQVMLPRNAKALEEYLLGTSWVILSEGNPSKELAFIQKKKIKTYWGETVPWEAKGARHIILHHHSFDWKRELHFSKDLTTFKEHDKIASEAWKGHRK